MNANSNTFIVLASEHCYYLLSCRIIIINYYVVIFSDMHLVIFNLKRNTDSQVFSSSLEFKNLQSFNTSLKSYWGLNIFLIIYVNENFK